MARRTRSTWRLGIDETLHHGQRWIACRSAFFLLIRVLSRLFRPLFLEMLVGAYDAGRLQFFGDHSRIDERDAFAIYLALLHQAPSAARPVDATTEDRRNGRHDDRATTSSASQDGWW